MQALRHFGCDPTWRDGIHPDRLRGPFARQRFGQLRHAALGRRIGWNPRPTKRAEHRSRVNDGPTLGGQQRLRGKAAAHRARQVDHDNLLKDLDVIFFVTHKDAGAIYQRVKAIQTAEHSFDRRLIGDVHDPSLKARFRLKPHNVFGRVAGADDTPARSRQNLCSACANSAGAASDEGNFAHVAPNC